MTLHEPSDPHAAPTTPAPPGETPSAASDETEEAPPPERAERLRNDTSSSVRTSEPPLTDGDDPGRAFDDGADEEADAETAAGAGDHRDDASVVQNVPHNQGTVIAVQNINDIRRLRGTPLDETWLKRQLRFYIPRDDTAKAIDARLTAHRVAVIHAQAGTGRYTTALHVLRANNMKAIRQIRREPNEAVDLGGLMDEDTGWILDLRAEEETLRTGFGLHLKEVKDHLCTTRSFVIVVTRSDTWSAVADEATELEHSLTPPTALEVFRRRLTHHKPAIQNLDQWLGERQIIQHLDGAVPAVAVRWAGIITTAEALNRSTTEPKPFPELVEFVVKSAQNWRQELLNWHTRNTDSAHRTYQLAAAVFDGASVETIREAHFSLGSALGDTPQSTKGQQGPGIIQLTHLIGAELGADDRIRFLKPGYTEAIVDYFWVDRPHHVAAFTRWTAEQATDAPRDLGTRLADRVTQWATRYTRSKQSFTILRTVATHWASTPHLADHAQHLLVAAAIDPTTGKRAREQYLAWAKGLDTADPADRGPTPLPLKRALAGALAQLGPAYPKIALKRLAELAANTTDATVTDAVGDALLSLWDQHDLRPKIRATLTSWFDASQRHYTAAARRAFLHLAGRTTPNGIPVLLAEGGSQPAPWALSGWRCAVDGELSRDTQDAVNTWLDAVLLDPDLKPTVLQTLTEAVYRSAEDRTYLVPRYLLLTHAAYGWEPARPGQQPTARTHLRDVLVTALREADPTAPTRLHHAPPPA
ncbi:MAG TPA: hypothetical protein VN520_31590 [Streptomyces sp.]|uniref:hypothetical protein n=1 Tax=Streptomyces sp. TaxID=1931 RepID=UPI002B67F189|nr:hypothetical protein [Streptomyces sp.]HWU10844.1 hypothetical protein [Streptomyces sp.]